MVLPDTLKLYWEKLYPGTENTLLSDFLIEVEKTKSALSSPAHQSQWYKDAIIYSLYVDLFDQDFDGLTQHLDYLQELGVNCLWLLPILDSPMKDAGFDIRHYDQIRADLIALPATASIDEKQKKFRSFLSEAHNRGLKVIFDIAINHTSEEHPWFVESRKSVDNPYREYYIWSKDTKKYKDARIIFEGLCESNWEKDGDWYYFHRFFEFQPDLNFRNPKVLLEMTRNFLFWLSQGVDGFRADAIPYLWKEDGTTCENHPMTHTVVKFFRAIIDYVKPNTLLLAEACQKPFEVVKYFGDGDECNAGYHFPLMPQIFKSLASENSQAIRHVLSREVTPAIPEDAQWFTFLRCHDELSLELVYVTEEDRKYIHENYCHKPEWDFRLGQGISARLSELLHRDPQKIGLAFSIMLTLPGTPIVYYGDEFGKLNDEAFYREMIKVSGKDDSRFLVRGKINWEQLDIDLNNVSSLTYRVFHQVKTFLNTRKKYQCFSRGDIQWLNAKDENNNNADQVLVYSRRYLEEEILVVQNLADSETTVKWNFNKKFNHNILGKAMDRRDGFIHLKAHEYLWLSSMDAAH